VTDVWLPYTPKSCLKLSHIWPGESGYYRTLQNICGLIAKGLPFHGWRPQAKSTP